jgi:hypothetical protein
VNLLISAVEINDHHGVGIFLRRLFPDSAISLPFGRHRFTEERTDLVRLDSNSEESFKLLNNVRPDSGKSSKDAE